MSAGPGAPTAPRAWRPADPARLPHELAEALATLPGTRRVAVDGPPCARPDRLAAALLEPLRALGRPAVHIPAELFWHDASVRLEHGHRDVESYLGWLDHLALQREVLRPVVERGQYLPSLRDPASDRSTRAAPQDAPAGTVLLVSGALLLGLGLELDGVVHLAMSPAARERHTPPEDAWTLPAFERYDDEVGPSDLADIVIRMDHPDHPAVRGLA